MSSISKNSFNLISKEITLRKVVKEEFTWHKYTNFAAFIAFSLLAVVAFLFRSYFENQFDQKRTALVDYIQKFLDVEKRQNAVKEINLINDRFKIYQHINDNGFDLVKFSNQFNKNFGDSVTINQIKIQNMYSAMDLEVSIKQNGYENLYDFLKKLNQNDIFSDYKIDLVIFNHADPLENSNVVIKLQANYLNSK